MDNTWHCGLHCSWFVWHCFFSTPCARLSFVGKWFFMLMTGVCVHILAAAVKNKETLHYFPCALRRASLRFAHLHFYHCWTHSDVDWLSCTCLKLQSVINEGRQMHCKLKIYSVQKKKKRAKRGWNMSTFKSLVFFFKFRKKIGSNFPPQYF